MKRTYDIKGMTCAACQAHVTKAARETKGVSNVNVNLLKNNMTVELDDDYVDGTIEKAIKDAGYTAINKDDNKNNIKIEENDHSLRDLIIGIIFLILLMYVSMGHMMWGFYVFDFMNMHINPVGYALSQFILVLPIIYIFRKYFINGFKRLFKGSPNMDSLIAIGSSASLIYGIIALFVISYGVAINDNNLISWHMHLYFESAGMILVLVSVGKYLEGLSKKKTTKAIDDLVKLAPKTALIKKDNKEIDIDAKDVKKGDIIILKRGMTLACDGIVINGTGSIDEATITGESIPKYKTLNDNCYQGTTLTEGYLEIEVTKEAKDSSIQTIIDLVNEASNSKAPISRLADRISLYFVPVILIIAVITFITNIIINKNFELSFRFAITVVVIACPCALGLATPVAIMVASGKGASLGLLIKNASILENTGKIKKIVFDKTGTLTEGKMKVSNYVDLNKIDNLNLIIYSIESKSNHPLAKAIKNYLNLDNSLEVSDITMLEGLGVKAYIDKDEYYIGNYRYLENISNIDEIKKLESEGKTALIVLKNNELVGYLALKDELRSNAACAIEEIKKLKIETIMLTGDNKDVANAIAKDAKIDKVYSEVLPVDKGNIINSLKGDGLVAMVGDGVNDAIALTNADIAISVSSGSDIAINSSDIVLIRNDIMDISNVIRLSKRSLNTIKLCLFWAFFYNVICVIIATGIFYYPFNFSINPMIGSIAMSISSVSVVLTALTINLFKPHKSLNNKLDIEMKGSENNMEIKVEGMMCKMCVKHVEEACLKSGAKTAVASLENKNVTVTGDVDLNKLVKAINDAGYKASL